MWERLREKLQVLSDAAKYDVSCSSSGSKRQNQNNGLGNASNMGICHSYTEDGRCVSLLKILLTNHCIYDCAYCVSRRSNDVKRIAFSVDEVVELTINFYRRNYIEGLFLSSGIFKDPDYTMERLVRVARKLREEHNFHGYIHLKTIPNASGELIDQAAKYADRLSVNIELPSEGSLKRLAPEKNYEGIFKPMQHLSREIQGRAEDKKLMVRKDNPYAPAGQSSQLVIGATPESDFQIMKLSDQLYQKFQLKRVYYSGYVPVSEDSRLPILGTSVPVIRENRLYQADWLMRYYHFKVDEIVNDNFENLELTIDPKLSWALRNPHRFPIDINTASYHEILRIPGVGLSSARKIKEARKFRQLSWEHLQKLGVVLSRARYFMTCNGREHFHRDISPERLRDKMMAGSKFGKALSPQMSLF